MSNLGSYQFMTTAAKKVGGPAILFGLVALSGYAASSLKRQGKKYFSDKTISDNQEASNTSLIGNSFEITSIGSDSSGVVFQVGDKYKVLFKDGDAVLIEKLGDENNPYLVSAELLKDISNFTTVKGQE